MGKVAGYAMVCTAAVLAGIAGFIGYRYFDGGRDVSIGLAAAMPLAVTDDFEPLQVSADDREVLSTEAKIVYRYHYLKDGYMESSAEDVPYFLVGLDRAELASRLMGWELVSFGPELAIFEKKIDARSTERYTVGMRDGYVAVFYDDNRLKDQTEIPVDALSDEELTRLASGIRVIGEDELLKVLEDYGS